MKVEKVLREVREFRRVRTMRSGFDTFLCPPSKPFWLFHDTTFNSLNLIDSFSLTIISTKI